MVGVSVRAQFAAVAQMRWRMLLNSFRTKRGGFEAGARIFSRAFFGLIGLGIGIGLGFAGWQIAAHNSLRELSALLWAVMAFWQLVPITVASFQENADLSILLRFPVNFASYALFYILFGLFDIGSIVGGIALFGIWIGASVARPNLMGWITLALAIFAVFNILLTRMIFSWIDRWLAQRRTREILGGVFLFLMLGAQLLNPAFYGNPGRHRRVGPSHAMIMRHLKTVERVQAFLPPGFAADAIDGAGRHEPFLAGADLMLLALYAAATGSLLALRLGAEYRGESLGEAPRRTAKAVSATSGVRLEGPGPVAAVIEKEIRYLMRSGVMLYGLLAPLLIVFLFSGNGRGAGPGFRVQYALPIGVAYGFLGLTRFIYNNLGGEGGGIQLYFLSPTPLRKVLLAKNIVHTMIFLLELVLVCAIVIIRTGIPAPQMLFITFAWLLFAVPAQLAIGNVLSITMAYRMNMTRMSREQGATGNGLLSVLAQLVIFGLGAAVYLPLTLWGHENLTAPILLVMAAGSTFCWLRTLSNSDGMIAARRESLIATVYRAA